MNSRVRGWATLSLLVVLAGMAPRSASGQLSPPAPETSDIIPNADGSTVVPTVVVAVLAGAGALAVPFDETIRDWVQRSSVQNSRAAGRTSDVVASFGGFAPILVGGSAYVVARLFNQPELSDAALHTTEGVVAALASTMMLKALVGRQRPYTGFGHLSFEPGDGRESRDLRSFPSGHSTTVFALAAGLTAEVRHLWPEHGGKIAAIFYPAAGLTALSRVYDDQHWTSDVLVGAGVGILVGTWVSRRNHASSEIAGGTLSATPIAGNGLGVAFRWSH